MSRPYLEARGRGPITPDEQDALTAARADHESSPANWSSIDDYRIDAEHKRSVAALLLDDVAAFVGGYVAFGDDVACHAVTLWAAHAHSLDAFESTPRLALISAVKQSGKTRTLEVLELLVPNPMNVVNTSSAALFRQVTTKRPTLLLDEADTYLGPHAAKQHEELRGFVNAGHRRAAKAYRCVGEPSRMYVEAFPAYCALAIAGIGDLPDTVIDRSVVIRMKRRAPGERVQAFRARHAAPIGNALRDRLAKWAKRNRRQLADLEAELPDGITDRAADVWESLVAIADLAGGYWPARARAACVKLNEDRERADVNLGLVLLADIRAAFDLPAEQPTLENVGAGADRLSSAELVRRLNAIEDAPWAHLSKGPLEQSGLARRLRAFDIGPASIRIGARTAKGYMRAWFVDAWERYLPAVPEDAVTGVTPGTVDTGDVPAVPAVTPQASTAGTGVCSTCSTPMKADGYCPTCDV